MDDKAVPIVLPDVGAEQHVLHVSSWFIEVGDWVEAGDRALEVLMSGVTCDVPCPCAGRLVRIEKEMDSVVHPGDVLAWIEPSPQKFEDVE